MRPHYLPILALTSLVPLIASAQQAASSVTLYGLLDASVNFQKFSATATRAASSGRSLSSDTSRFGLRGSEDLGGGMRAYFKMESGFNIDTGTQSSPTAFWNRETLVGLSHPSWGSVQMGSQFTPSLWLTTKTDPFGRAGSGALFTLFQAGGAAGPRGYAVQHNNAIQYLTPNLGGVVGRLLVATSEGVAPFGNPVSASVEYGAGRLFIGAAYDRLNTAGAAAGQPGWSL